MTIVPMTVPTSRPAEMAKLYLDRFGGLCSRELHGGEFLRASATRRVLLLLQIMEEGRRGEGLVGEAKTP